MPLPNYGYPGAAARCPYGGYADIPFTGTYLKGTPGYFRTGIMGEKVCMVCPDGHVWPWLAVWTGNNNSLSRQTTDVAPLNRVGGYIDAKYGFDTLKSSQSFLYRMKAWGFNCAMIPGTYGSAWVAPWAHIAGTTNFWFGANDPRPPGGTVNWQRTTGTRFASPTPQPTPIPATVGYNYAREGSNNTFNILDAPFKNVYQTTPALQPSYFTPDVFDPRWLQYYTALLPAQATGTGNTVVSATEPWCVGVMLDDTDGMDGFGGGPLDQGFDSWAIQGHNPHIGYFCAVSRPWVPTGQSSTAVNFSYTDPTHFSKARWKQYLIDKYGTIAALNAAWNTGGFYTTFDMQDEVGHTSWGPGTGVMDEDGRHAWFGNLQANFSLLLRGSFIGNINANVLIDVDEFLYIYGTHYFSSLKNLVSTVLPNYLYVGPFDFGTWGLPPNKQLLRAAGPYLDATHGQGIWPGHGDEAARIAYYATHLGNPLPLVQWAGRTANPDSGLYGFGSTDLATQEARGVAYRDVILSSLPTRNPTDNLFYCNGLSWWERFDNWGEVNSWGLCSIRQNPYDGVNATTTPPANEVVEIAGGDGVTRQYTYANYAEDFDYGDMLSTVIATNIGVHDTMLLQTTGEAPVVGAVTGVAGIAGTRRTITTLAPALALVAGIANATLPEEPMATGDIKAVFATEVAFSAASNLASLANNEGKPLGEVDNTSAKYLDALILLDITLGASGVSATGTLELYLLEARVSGTTTYTDGIDPDSTSNVAGSLKNARPMGPALTANANNQVVRVRLRVRDYVAELPPCWSVVVVNKSAAALAASGHSAEYVGIYANVEP